MDQSQYQQQLTGIWEQLFALADKFQERFKSGGQPSDIFMSYQNELVQQLNMEPRRANAIVNLALEAMINKYEKRGHFKQEQILQYWQIAFPNIPLPMQQGQQQAFPAQGQGFPPAGQGF